MLYLLTALSDGGDFFNLSFATSRSVRAVPFSRAVFWVHLWPSTDQRFAPQTGQGQPIRDDGPRAILSKRGRQQWAAC